MKKTLRLTIVIILAVLIPTLPFVVVGELPGERWLSQSDDNALLFALTGSGLLTLDMFFPVYSSMIGTAMGARLGFASGTLWCWSGLMVGNLIGFWLAHLMPKRFATLLPDEPTEAILFLSRPVPVFAEAAVFAAGANRVALRAFLIPCALGNGIFSLVLCANAAYWLPESWKGPGLILPMLLPVVCWLAWRRYGPHLGADGQA